MWECQPITPKILLQTWKKQYMVTCNGKHGNNGHDFYGIITQLQGKWDPFF